MDYYFSQVYRDERYGNVMTWHTIWVGFADRDKRIELREPRKQSLTGWQNWWDGRFGIELKVIDSVLELYEFLLLGGTAVIRADICEAELAEKLQARTVARDLIGPYRNVDDIDAAGRRAPSKKLRMRILKRDGYRCRLCGQSPNDNTNITLNLHHILPWANHGATVDNNLVTLCHTCHEGLDPHDDMQMASHISDTQRDPSRWKQPPALGPCEGEV